MQALLWRQGLAKKRSWRGTLAEVLAPVLVLAGLVVAYTLTDQESRAERIVLGQTKHTIQRLSASLEDWSGRTSYCAALWQNASRPGPQPLLVDPAGAQVYAGTEGVSGAAAAPSSLSACQDTLRNSSGDLTAALTAAAQRLIDRNGPLPILTLDEFILLHELLQAALPSDGEALDALRHLQSSFGRNVLGNLIELGQVAFVPRDADGLADVLSFTDYMLKHHKLFWKYFKGVFESEAAAEAYALTASPRLWALVIFSSGPNQQGSEYTIRMNYTCVPSASETVNRHTHGFAQGYKRYFTSGFLAAIEGYSLSMEGGTETGLQSLGSGSSPMPMWASVFGSAAYIHNVFYEAVGPALGLLVSMSLVYPLSQLVRGMVQEKETRAQATMEIMGLELWVLPTAWAITYGAMLTVTVALMAAVCCLSFLRHTASSLVFTVFLLFAFSEIGFGFVISSIFSNSKIAAIASPFLHFASVLPRYIFIRTEENQAVPGKLATSLLAPSAFTFTADVFTKFEAGGSGVQWRDVLDGPLPLGALMGMLAVDTVLYLALAACIRALPSIRRSCWLRTPRATTIPGTATSASAVEACGLHKVYGKKAAVRGVSMEMRSGEVTSLLGHNGAGKTSVVGMMTGLLSPTAGDCTVMGKSIVHDPSGARRHIGYCPQANVLFHYMTVWEHLLMYSAIKRVPGGIRGRDAARAAEDLLQAVDLEVQRDVYVTALSGGMKRRLQVALALIGDSEVVILDEPTCGVDPASRRGIWALLAGLKERRAMLLITHFTDEADILSDQVVIMAEGRVLAAGPPLQLKQQYSDGYTLRMNLRAGSASPAARAGVTRAVREHVPGAGLVRAAAAELVFRLPLAAAPTYADLLESIDARQADLGVEHYSIAMPTLEEAFLQASTSAGSAALASADRLIDGGASEQQLAGDGGGKGRGRAQSSPDDGASEPDLEAAEGHTLLNGASQARARSTALTALCEMLKKRMRDSARDAKAVFFTLVLPVCALCLVMLILKVDIDPSSPTMALDLAAPPQTGALPSMNLPAALEPCRGDGLHSAAGGPCGGGLGFQDYGTGDSRQMNHLLLQGLSVGHPAQYAGVVFDDPVINDLVNVTAHFAGGSGSAAARTSFQLAAAAAGIGSKISHAALATATAGASSALFSTVNLQILNGMIQRLGSNSHPVNLLHNASAQHALPSLLSGVHETLAAVRAKGSDPGVRFAASSHPLPLSLEESEEMDSILMVLAAMFVLIPFCMLTGYFCVNPVMERVSQSYHLQILSGCAPAVYWAGSLVWDMAVHTLISLLSLAVFAAFGDKATTGSLEQAAGSLAVLLSYGAAVIPATYCLSFAFSSPSGAQVVTTALTFLAGFCAVNASYVMAHIPKTKALQRVAVHILRMFPPFLFGEALIDLTLLHYTRIIASRSTALLGRSNALIFDKSVFDWSVLGRPIAFMLLESMAACAGVLAVDALSRSGGAAAFAHWARCLVLRAWRGATARACCAMRSAGPRPDELELGRLTERHPSAGTGEAASGADAPSAKLDDMVAAERRFVDSGAEVAGSISIRHLTKVYPGDPPKVALDDLCLTIEPGETFGLLGCNGAGKSTLLGLLTRRARATHGSVIVGGEDLLTARLGTASRIGFCPQSDPLIDTLTAREQLAMFARLKGVAKLDVSDAVEDTLRRVGIPDEMARRPVGQYSGGNRRKLALGIALVGGVDAILLDEPSSGVDPGSRRAMWDCITSAVSQRSAFQRGPVTAVLTTHSMEECEALCGRVGILHEGRLRCLGTLGRLKQAYAAGYTLEVFPGDAEAQRAAVTAFVESSLGGTVVGRDSSRITFALPVAGLPAAGVFRQLEASKQELSVAAYGLSQPTLEAVFLNVVGDDLSR